MEIFRKDGEEFTSIEANFNSNGDLSIDGQDMGPLVEEFWGDSDYEYFLTIPKSEMNDFILVLIKKAFSKNGKLHFSDLMNICKENEIKYHYDYWI